jgi:hypothetical protein
MSGKIEPLVTPRNPRIEFGGGVQGKRFAGRLGPRLRGNDDPM